MNDDETESVLPDGDDSGYASQDDFEWDDDKAEINLTKHGVEFGEAATVFDDPLQVTVDDKTHSTTEDRYITVGLSADERLLIVSHTDRNRRTRIISARVATRRERKDYEDGRFP